MKEGFLVKALGLVILFVLGFSLILQLQTSNQDNANLMASVKVLEAQVEALGGEPASDPEPSDEPVIIVGERGERGERGFQGTQGPQGEPGATGSQGPAGPSGPTGPTGPSGESGPTGPEGPAGVPGPQGAQGIQGPEGPAGYPTSWTYTYDGPGGETTVVCSDPDGDRNYTCA